MHPLHPLEQGPKAEPPQSGNRSRIETIGGRHALEPVDSVALPPRDEPEPAYGLLVAAQQMRKDVFDGPAVLRARPQHLGLG